MSRPYLVLIACAVLALPSFAACKVPKAKTYARERHLVVLGTNDIHGGVEASKDKEGQRFGGSALFSGVVAAIRQGTTQKYGDSGGVLVLDAGDQFQGTLVSNFDEGQLVFSTMNAIGYDAIVPGNHDYDFGPIGWLEDKVTPQSQDQNPRGALLRLVKQAKFPLLSANTFHKASILDIEGRPQAELRSIGCLRPGEKSGEDDEKNTQDPAPELPPIDWSKARNPEFLTRYLIKEVAGVRVAVIGLDNIYTPTTTTPENVSDLCFRDEFETYRDLRAELEGKADVFVLVIHDGNSNGGKSVSRLVEKLSKLPGGNVVHAVLAGHTHFVHNDKVGLIPIVQSGSGGERFGRIDLVFDSESRQVIAERTESIAGVRAFERKCDDKSKPGFCSAAGAEPGPEGVVTYDGVALVEDAAILARVAGARERVAPLAGRRIGFAEAEITRDRVVESPMSNHLTDALRAASGAEVAMMNTGGIRDTISAGEVTYEDLFRVLPFGNHGVVVGPMQVEKLLDLIRRSAKTCGSYGALMQSGLRVSFTRDCKSAKDGLDEKSALLKVETVAGELIFDSAQGGLQVPATRTFAVATLDFLASGGSGYSEFIGTPLIQDLGIIREVMVTEFLQHPFRWKNETDGRWVAK